ncbi:hypothetical protein GCM10019059_10250 [Camelimonas fluminis]|nr:hypothetical protein GCM10019059_10250 [Camelimonas fluminis]
MLRASFETARNGLPLDRGAIWRSMRRVGRAAAGGMVQFRGLDVRQPIRLPDATLAPSDAPDTCLLDLCSRFVPKTVIPGIVDQACEPERF